MVGEIFLGTNDACNTSESVIDVLWISNKSILVIPDNQIKIIKIIKIIKTIKTIKIIKIIRIIKIINLVVRAARAGSDFCRRRSRSGRRQ